MWYWNQLCLRLLCLILLPCLTVTLVWWCRHFFLLLQIYLFKTKACVILKKPLVVLCEQSSIKRNHRLDYYYFIRNYTQDLLDIGNRTYTRPSGVAQDVFWTSYMSSVDFLCSGSKCKVKLMPSMPSTHSWKNVYPEEHPVRVGIE